jgi:predicted TIM-barrel fold metal-dependent hydrolase
MPIFEAVEASGKVLNIHSGTVSKNNNNLDDIRRFCNVDRFRRALRRTPNLKVIVPHIGYDEVQEYLELMDEFPNLYFDTAMAIGGHRVAIGEPLPDARPLHYRHYERGNHPHLPTPWKPALEQLIPQILAKPTRFLYGSDFPNLPYLWNFEIDQLARYLPDDILQQILWANAANLFGCEQSAEDSEEIVLAGETS